MTATTTQTEYTSADSPIAINGTACKGAHCMSCRAYNLLVKSNYPYQHLDRDQGANEIKELTRSRR